MRYDEELISKFSSLPAGYFDFKNANTKEYSHGFHTYPATMVSPISRTIIKLIQEIRPVSALFDPFSGSGTVLVEGLLAGIPNIAGNDLNPLAQLISRVKTSLISSKLLLDTADVFFTVADTQIRNLENQIQSANSYICDTLKLSIVDSKGLWAQDAPKLLRQYCEVHNLSIPIPDFKGLGYWFKPSVILYLSIIKAEIDKIPVPDVRDFFLVAFSECVRLVSNRRNGEYKLYRMPPDKVMSFNPHVYQIFALILFSNINKMAELCDVKMLNKNSIVTIFSEDTRTLSSVPDNTYDLVITSPPYGDSRTTVAYGEFSRLSLQWIDPSNYGVTSLDKRFLGGIPKLDETRLAVLCSHSALFNVTFNELAEMDYKRAKDVYQFYSDLDESVQAISKKTAHDGYQFWVVGNRTVKGKILPTYVILTQFARHYGLVPIYFIARSISNKVMPLQGSPSNIAGDTIPTMTQEYILVFRKS